MKFMGDILKYEMLEKLFEDSEEIIYRVLDGEYNKKVIMKMYKDECSIHEQYMKIKNEYDVLTTLNINGVIKACGIDKNKENPVIILEDFDGAFLKNIIDKSPMGLEGFLIAASKLTNILEINMILQL